MAEQPITPHEQEILESLRAVLIPGETLEAWAIERRLFAMTHRRRLIAATSGRFITLSRRLLGGYDPVDLRWQDLKEVRINVGLFSAELSLTAYEGADLTLAAEGSRVLKLTGLRKFQAQEVYRVCQAQEQAWREKRRVRDMEEMRARAGGIQFARDADASDPGSAGPNTEAMQRLKRAKEMLDAKLITDSEYEAIKAKVIGQV